MTLQEIFKALGEGKTLASTRTKHEISMLGDQLLTSFEADATLTFDYIAIVKIIMRNKSGWIIKKPAVTINGVELVAPEREPLAIGEKYFVVFIDSAVDSEWKNDNSDQKWLKNGQVFKYEEDAKAMYQALAGILK